MRTSIPCSAFAAALLCSSAHAQDTASFNRVATFPVESNLPSDRDAASATAAEIIAASEDGMKLIYTDSPQKAVGLIDISDPKAPKAAGFVPVEGEPTSVTVIGGKAFVGVVTSDSFTEPKGQLALVDLAAKTVEPGCELPGQPDSVARSADGAKIAIVLENQRDEDLNDGALPQLPSGALAVFDVKDGAADCASLKLVTLSGLAEVSPEDAEPEFVDINEAGQAVVTLQENNHLAVVDLESGEVLKHFSAGAVDLEGIDTEEDGVIRPDDKSEALKREPDSVQWLDAKRFATANEGDLDGGSRGFSIFNTDGEVLFDSGAALEKLAMRIGHYPEGRSDAKGSEPEGLEVARFGSDQLIFVASERGSFVAVYRDAGAAPEFLQVLPSGVGPEGLLAVPSRNLFVSANEEDLVEDGGARATVMIYERGEAGPSYPTIQAAETFSGGWGALSGLTVDAASPGRLYAVSDSAYSEAQIFEIDATKQPAEITRAITVTENGAPMPMLDLEGIAARADGGFWLASEGNPKEDLANRLLRVSSDGAVEEVIALPDSIAAGATGSGLEGVTVSGSGDAEVVWLAVQREWKDDDEGSVKLLSYKPASLEWGVLRYPLEAPEGEGWIGLSEITAIGEDKLVIIERDNQIGEAAKVKALYSVSLAGIEPAVPGEDAPMVQKTLLRDLVPDLKAANGYILDKVESFALDRDGKAYIITDNDGVDDSSGETQFIVLEGLDVK
jgi:hypothetical protein